MIFTARIDYDKHGEEDQKLENLDIIYECPLSTIALKELSFVSRKREKWRSQEWEKWTHKLPIYVPFSAKRYAYLKSIVNSTKKLHILWKKFSVHK